MAKRRPPSDVRRQVLMEAGYRCGVPTCRNILALEAHHIVHVSEDGGDTPDNLIALCGFCHDLYHKGEITREAIRYWKGILAALNHAFDRESIDLLLFLRQPHPRLVISGDGVLKFSRLIAAGLASYRIFVFGSTGGLAGSFTAMYEVRLTPKGEMLVDAWLAGDRTAVENTLAQSHNSQ